MWCGGTISFLLHGNSPSSSLFLGLIRTIKFSSLPAHRSASLIDEIMRDGEQTVSVCWVFFDQEKAYDTTWKYWRVRLGTFLLHSFPQGEGVPQGSVLSFTIFVPTISDITSCSPGDIYCTLCGWFPSPRLPLGWKLPSVTLHSPRVLLLTRANCYLLLFTHWRLFTEVNLLPTWQGTIDGSTNTLLGQDFRPLSYVTSSYANLGSCLSSLFLSSSCAVLPLLGSRQ